MSHAASHHVKLLTIAPNGKRITAAEKVILALLADDHNEQVGLAWPKVGTLARLAGMSQRNCRKTLAALEKKGVIQRHPTVRVNDTGQSSNEYSFVGLPVTVENVRRLEENLAKFQRTQRIRLPFTPRSNSTSPPVKLDLPPRSKMTYPPGQL